MDQIDLTICQVCKKNPATYGDGLTWSRCSKCELEYEKGVGVASADAPEGPEQSFEHEIVPNLVSVIIPVYMVNYTLFHYTGNCIGAVKEHTKEGSYELVIIDNGSPIKPPDLKSYYAHRIVQNEENIGVTKAWNKGIRCSVGEYIVLLNNDVQVFDHWLEDMKEVLDNNLADLVMAHPMYSLTEPFARATEANLAREGKKKFDDIPGGRDFSCVMFKRSLLDELGLFDEIFFSYCSDVDLLKRMDEAGKTYRIVPVFTSHISDATGFSMEKTSEIMDQDKAKFKEKWDQIEKEKKEISLKPEDLATTDGYKVDVKTAKLFRTNLTGDAIFVVFGEEYHHIKNPDTLHALGFDFGQEQTLEKTQVDSLYSRGEDINMDNVEKFKNV